jgi:hypothetical protein
MNEELPEDFQPASEKIRVRVKNALLSVKGVFVTIANNDALTLLKTPPKVLAYEGAPGDRVVSATPLVIWVRCSDEQSWPRINRTLEKEGFELFGERNMLGSQAYMSTKRAWFVIEEHPRATMAVERTGKSVLGWIAEGNR